MALFFKLGWKLLKPVLLAEGARMLMQRREQQAASPAANPATSFALVGAGVVAGAAAVWIGGRLLNRSASKTSPRPRRRRALSSEAVASR